MIPSFNDIKIVINYETMTYYPTTNNYLGEIIDDFLKYGVNAEKVLNNMRFFYGIETTRGKWEPAACTEDDKPIWTTISMKLNPNVRLLGQDGLFCLAFFGHHPDTGRFTHVETFEEQLKLVGMRVVTIIRPAFPEYTTRSSIPKRLDSSHYRF